MQTAGSKRTAGPPAALSPTSYTILGLLVLRNWSGYQITQQVRRGLGQLWPRAERQLYNDPKRLVEGGYVAATPERVGGRGRTTYSITRRGKAALKGWFATPARPPVLEFEAMVRVLFADQGTLAELRATLEEIAEQARATRAEYGAFAAHQVDGGEPYPTRYHTNALAMRFMIGHLEHLITWSNWALEATRAWPDTTTPATTWADEAAAIFRDAARHAAAADHGGEGGAPPS